LPATNPDPVTETQVGADLGPTSEEMDFDQRLEAANSRTSALLTEAFEQLTAPCVAPKELTPEEEAEKAAALKWAREYGREEEIIEGMERSNNGLFREVIGIADSLVARETVTGPKTEEQSLAQSESTTPDFIDREVQTADQFLSLVDEPRRPPVESITLSEERSSTSTPQPESARRLHRSLVLPSKQMSVINRSRPVVTEIKKNTATEKAGWHTLWGCDFEARW
jgi:hypothetical protein